MLGDEIVWVGLKMRGGVAKLRTAVARCEKKAANHSQPSLKQRHGRHRAQAWQAEGPGMACQYCQPSFNHPNTLVRVGWAISTFGYVDQIV